MKIDHRKPVGSEPNDKQYGDSVGSLRHPDNSVPADTGDIGDIVASFPSEGQDFPTIRDHVAKVFGDKVASSLKVNEIMDFSGYLSDDIALYQISLLNFEISPDKHLQFWGERELIVIPMIVEDETAPLLILVLPPDAGRKL